VHALNTRNIGLTGLLAAALLAAGCSRQERKAEAASKPPEPVGVKTAIAEQRQLDKIVSVTGSLLPDETVTMSFEVQGRVAAIYTDFGQAVRKGQVLAELDKQELSFQVERSKAAVAQALARLGLDPAQENVTPETTPATRQAAAQMEDARNKYESAQKLVKTGDISNERFVEIEKSLHARQAAYEATRDDIRTQIASVRALQAEVKLAQKRLGDTTIRAPFDGAVAQKLVSPGQYIKDNTPVLTLVKNYPLRLRADIPENASGAVGLGTTLTFVTDAIPGAQFNAVVRQLNPTLDAKSRSLTAEARLISNDPRLRPGMFVQVQLALAKGSQVVVVPKQAIYNIAGLNKLFIVRDGKTVEQKISPGSEIDGWVEVPAGQVNAGDKVAVTSLQYLVGGSPVKVLN
jgi:RND family efflux transporter MFP subunit